jgi:uncharacterized membrane protein YfcA
MNLEPWQWILAVVGALLVGISKTGVAGLGLLAVVMFAQVFPAKQATGLVLPLLICGDLIAVASYRRHTQWHYLWKLFPWTAAGVLAGFFALGRIDDRQARVMIGGIVLVLLALHLVRRKGPTNADVSTRKNGRPGGAGFMPAVAGVKSAPQGEHGVWFAPTVGILAGFTTLVANAAGPLMVIYFLAMRLPKMEFVGTGAVFFLLLNLFKVPFMVRLGLINGPSLMINLWLAPAVLVGTYFGRKILVKMDQRLFENVALVLSAIAGAKLLW